MKVLEGCTFCMDVPNYNQITKNTVPLERIVTETPNFRVIVTLGQIPENGGYIIILPREHYACIGEMSEELIKEFSELKDEFDMRITAKYTKPVHFEHGVIGQTIFHAHLHSIPFPPEKDLFERFRKAFPHHAEIESLVELRDIWKKHSVYVYYEKNSRKFAFYTDIFPMYARYEAAKELDVPERGNWRNVPPDRDRELILSTVKNLKEP